MLEKLALLKIALCNAPVVRSGSPFPTTAFTDVDGVRRSKPSFFLMVMTFP
jgi:hypothetical protein